MAESLLCPACGAAVETWRNPAPTVDIIIHEPERGIVLVERANPPFGFALPGGFVDTGETVEQAAVREALEETGLEVVLDALLGVYSDPARDPRRHTMSTVFIAHAVRPDCLRAGDDAAKAVWAPLKELPEQWALAFDHARIVSHFKAALRFERAVARISAAD